MKYQVHWDDGHGGSGTFQEVHDKKAYAEAAIEDWWRLTPGVDDGREFDYSLKVIEVKDVARLSQKLEESAFAQYLRENFEQDDYVAVNRLYRGEQRTAMRQEVLPVTEVASADYQEFLKDANRYRNEIYVSVNAFKPEASGRKKDDVAAVRHVYLDIDKDGPAALEKILKSEMLPHHVFESSPGRYQALWSVEGLSVPEAEAAVRRMAHEWEGDRTVWDAARILRAPGFRNWKPEYADVKPWVKEVEIPPAPKKVYELADLMMFQNPERDWQREGIPLPREKGVERESGERGRGQGLTQSERDWKYAMTHLEKGEDPEKITADIAKYRSDPAHGYKHNPEQYAALTVEKARQQRER